MKNAFKTAFLVCSSIIGAGFASGREVVEFFPPGRGFASSVVSVLLISVFVYIILKHGGNICKFPLYRIGVGMFSVCVLAVMIAAAEEIMPFGRLFMAVAAFVTVICGMRGIENVSSVLCPAMILFIILFGLKRTYGICLADVSFGIRFDAFLYAGYNVLSFPVLLRQSGEKSPGLTSAIVFVVMLCCMIVVYSASSLCAYGTMPFFEAVGGGVFVTLMMLAALYTTAVCSAFCVCDFLGGGVFPAVFVVITAFLCSYTGFGNLISNGYRTFGFAGLLAVLWEITDEFLRRREKRLYLRLFRKYHNK